MRAEERAQRLEVAGQSDRLDQRVGDLVLAPVLERLGERLEGGARVTRGEQHPALEVRVALPGRRGALELPSRLHRLVRHERRPRLEVRDARLRAVGDRALLRRVRDLAGQGEVLRRERLVAALEHVRERVRLLPALLDAIRAVVLHREDRAERGPEPLLPQREAHGRQGQRDQDREHPRVAAAAEAEEALERRGHHVPAVEREDGDQVDQAPDERDQPRDVERALRDRLGHEAAVALGEERDRAHREASEGAGEGDEDAPAVAQLAVLPRAEDGQPAHAVQEDEGRQPERAAGERVAQLVRQHRARHERDPEHEHLGPVRVVAAQEEEVAEDRDQDEEGRIDADRDAEEPDVVLHRVSDAAGGAPRRARATKSRRSWPQ